MDKIAVLIPCYNEEKTIEKVVRDAKGALPEAVVYVYDNNSTDRSVELAERAGAVVRRERKQGKGNVIRRMFREIEAQCYIMVDADDTYPLECAGQMADKVLLDHSDMVVGDRLSSTYYEENKRPFHNMGNSLVKRSINLLFHSEIQDIMTGYRAFSYQFVKSFPVLSKGFEIETEIKLNTYSDGIRVLGTILRMFRQYKPLAFFAGLAVLLTAISAAFFIPVLIAFLETGMVDKFPTLIVCGFVELAAIQSVFSGLILHNLGVKERRDFEMRLYEISGRRKTEE